MIITPDMLAQAIASSPAWAEIASGTPQKRICDDAHHELAKQVYGALWRPLHG